MKGLAYKTLNSEIQVLPGISRVILPLRQMGGQPLAATVEVGQQVEKGQCIGKSDVAGEAFLHSPISGEVKRLYPSVLYDGEPVEVVEIEKTGDDSGEVKCLAPMGEDAADLSSQALQERLQEAGVTPLGGNGKNLKYAALAPGETSPEVLLVCCSDEDPRLQTQHQILQEEPEKVIEGATLFQKAIGAKRLVFAVSDDLKQLVSGETVVIDKSYPGAHPEILMARVTDKYRMTEPRPRQDIYTIDAQTAAAARNAIREGRPVTQKVVTVGNDSGSPALMKVPLGTPFSLLLEKAGLKAEDGDRLYTGGPLCGLAQFDLEGPVTKGIDGLFLQKKAQAFLYEDVACIGCGQCLKACPMKITVNMMTRNCEFGRIEQAEAYDLDCCIECGLCAYVCTARRPLLQYILFAKKEKQKLEQERQSE